MPCAFARASLSASISLLNALIHLIIDQSIWNVYKYIKKKQLKGTNVNDFQYWEDKMFWNFVGLDQLLHILTILFVYHGLLK